MKTRNIDELKDDIIRLLDEEFCARTLSEITKKLGYKPSARSYVLCALKILLQEKRIIREKFGRAYRWDTGLGKIGNQKQKGV